MPGGDRTLIGVCSERGQILAQEGQDGVLRSALEPLDNYLAAPAVGHLERQGHADRVFDAGGTSPEPEVAGPWWNATVTPRLREKGGGARSSRAICEQQYCGTSVSSHMLAHATRCQPRTLMYTTVVINARSSRGPVHGDVFAVVSRHSARIAAEWRRRVGRLVPLWRRYSAKGYLSPEASGLHFSRLPCCLSLTSMPNRLIQMHLDLTHAACPQQLVHCRGALMPLNGVRQCRPEIFLCSPCGLCLRICSAASPSTHRPRLTR